MSRGRGTDGTAPGRQPDQGPRGFVHRHIRLLLAAVAGLAAGLAFGGLSLPDRLLIGADLFFAIYLAACFLWLRGLKGTDLRSRFEDGDEGAAWLSGLIVLTIVVSLYAIIATLTGSEGAARGPIALLRPILALAAVPLGWTTLHMIMALHYAAIFYRARDHADPETVLPASPTGDRASMPSDRGGLDFAGNTPEPGPWEFLYYSFTIGMTAQTSDTAVTSTRMRRLTLVHGALSYFYNAVIVALAVNAGLSLGQ